MAVSELILIIGFIIFFVSAVYIIIQTLTSKAPADPSEPKGDVLPAVLYSFTGAMSPFRKETAYKHWPTYIAGILFHMGVFLSFAWLIIHVTKIALPSILVKTSALFLGITVLCGFGILLKRAFNAKMRYFSCIDDYFSNIIVTMFLIISLLVLLYPQYLSILYILSGILFIYIPLGKLRHAVFFILTRTYLAKFYGKRGVWPPGRKVI